MGETTENRWLVESACRCFEPVVSSADAENEITASIRRPHSSVASPHYSRERMNQPLLKPSRAGAARAG